MSDLWDEPEYAEPEYAEPDDEGPEQANPYRLLDPLVSAYARSQADIAAALSKAYYTRSIQRLRDEVEELREVLDAWGIAKYRPERPPHTTFATSDSVVLTAAAIPVDPEMEAIRADERALVRRKYPMRVVEDRLYDDLPKPPTPKPPRKRSAR